MSRMVEILASWNRPINQCNHEEVFRVSMVKKLISMWTQRCKRTLHLYHLFLGCLCFGQLNWRSCLVTTMKQLCIYMHIQYTIFGENCGMSTKRNTSSLFANSVLGVCCKDFKPRTKYFHIHRKYSEASYPLLLHSHMRKTN